MVQSFEDVAQLVHSATDPESAISALVRYLEDATEPEVAEALLEVDAQEDVASVRDQLSAVLRAEPPRVRLNAFYFGLFEGIDREGNENIGYYVSGVEHFDPEDSDTLCDPVWCPEARYLESGLLAAIKVAEIRARERGQPDQADLLGYAGQLGVAAVLTKFASQGLFGSTPRVVGFDSGDYLELDLDVH